ncbi:hypothetical protein [Cognatiyoonia sp. IB215182]|uniref:hypothetical protein n=1 Tax=Cognatiyoonia sp. IB215182 TaxID=3097353 RepID=UPI002A119421|nr:hypothetical protein [Cognatiyoonia sp. IB215182]MDX8352748.1 hypothetical protein [Cognatiyoonia sp. IB215182]
MEFDVIFVLGLLLALFSAPSFASAYADKRRPTQALLTVLIGAGMIYYAVVMNPGVYAVDQVDDVVLRVIGWVLNE